LHLVGELLGTCSLKEGVVGRKSWRVITIKTDPWGRKARLITAVKSTVHRKEKV
jgi:hypothetical protein